MDVNNKYISIAIPTYEMNGMGSIYLEYSFNILLNQTFKDFEIIISDHSTSDIIEKLCDKYSDLLDIKYIKNINNIGSSSSNINNAIRNSNGKIIKILFQDDFLYDENSLMDIYNNFDIINDKWLVTPCEHCKDDIKYFRQFYPQYNHNIHLGNNTISSPSVLTIKNDDPLLFDENLIWLMDCDYYRRCYDVYGLPKITNNINVVNRVGDHQVSNTLATDTIKNDEYLYILKKYNNI